MLLLNKDYIGRFSLTLNSKAAIPIPDAAPVPANPMKCPDPILLANNDAPTFND